jgi:DNA-binding MarR family transcriptional regulator
MGNIAIAISMADDSQVHYEEPSAVGAARQVGSMRIVSSNDPQNMGVAQLLGHVTREVRSVFEAELSKHGLSGAAWRVLAELSFADGQTQAGLAAKLEISRMATGQTIDRMERDGWIERRPDETDRRSWRIHMTKSSREQLPSLRAAARQAGKACFAVLSAAEMQTLERLLLKLQAQLYTGRTHAAGLEQEA